MVTVAAASAAVGAGLGIMFAPKKGSKFRIQNEFIKKVHKKANELKDSVEDLWNSAYEKGDEVIQKAVDELKTKVNKAISSIEKHLED